MTSILEDRTDRRPIGACSIDPAFWQGQRVLVTGHTGFKGAWACLLLSELGADVMGLSLPPDEPSLYTQTEIKSRISQNHLIDLADLEAVRSAIKATQPKIVLHFAAQSLVRRAHRNPVETMRSNVLGTVHLLEALRSCTSVRQVLITTTDKVYHNAEHGLPFREGDRIGGHEPYSASKSAAEMVIAAYRSSYFAKLGIPILVARAGNVIGGGDWCEDRIIPDIVRSIISHIPLNVRRPNAVRPWQHVLDALEGYLLLIQSASHAAPDATLEPEHAAWNFGPDVEDHMPTVEDICKIAQRRWPNRFQWSHIADPYDINESQLLLLDPSRAMNELGWRPRLAVSDALNETFEWYRRFVDGEDAKLLCAEEIAKQIRVRVETMNRRQPT
ncbi:MAG: CDP-glucose 4,6-dehydratase [Hyphomicrobium sp.]|nr:MAG: CDP-glucose 4,6-dehydratase [Hyphomicrobium sp.]PPD01591.1 MAG: CDP-glucose 4,6-dehydratase [Hyphomicrobium sp.]